MKMEKEYYEYLYVKFQRKLNGYTISPRSRYLLLINKDLSEEEYFLYAFISDCLTDWDTRHDLYGTCEIYPEIVASNLKWSISKFRRIFKKLIKNGYLSLLTDFKYSVTGFILYKEITKKKDQFCFYKELKEKINVISIEQNTDENS
jgi:hypothetical protein